jgi:hypothetical protein
LRISTTSCILISSGTILTSPMHYRAFARFRQPKAYEHSMNRQISVSHVSVGRHSPNFSHFRP